MNLPDNIVQAIIASMMDTRELQLAWDSIDVDERYVIMDEWKLLVQKEVEAALLVLFGD